MMSVARATHAILAIRLGTYLNKAVPICPPTRQNWLDNCDDHQMRLLLSDEVEIGFRTAIFTLLELQQADMRSPTLREYEVILAIMEGLRIADCLSVYAPCVAHGGDHLIEACGIIELHVRELGRLAGKDAELLAGPLRRHACNGKDNWADSLEVVESALQGALDVAYNLGEGHRQTVEFDDTGAPNREIVGVAPFLYPSSFSPGGICGPEGIGNLIPIAWNSAADESAAEKPWRDVSGQFSAVHFSSNTILRKLDRHGVTLSHFVINLGASDGRCTAGSLYDPANCLLLDGSGGMVFEGREDNFLGLARRYGTRADVHLKLGWTTPSAAVAALEAVGAPRSPDLLKVDVDNCDTCFVEAVLDRYDPKLIHVEIEAELPPGLVRRHPFVTTPGAFGPGHGSPGSLGAFIQAVRPRYKLLHVEFVNALFVRSDLNHIADVGFPAAGRSNLDRWRIGYYCHPLRSTWQHSPESVLRRNRQIDTSIFGDPGFPLEVMQGVVQEQIFPDDPPGTYISLDPEAVS